MLKIFKNGNCKDADKIIGDLKKTEQNFINSINAELKKLNAVNTAMYEICPEETETTGYKTGCNCCNKCQKFNGVI